MEMPLNRQGGRVRAPLGGRARENRKFIQASSPEIWRKTISGGEEVLAGKWGGLFWATSLEKIFGGVIAIISCRPGGCMQQSAVPRCAILSVGAREASGSETPRVHNVARRCGRVAARCAGAAGGDAGIGFLGVGSLDNYGLLSSRFPQGPQRCARWVRHEHHGDWNLRRYASMDSHRRHHSGGCVKARPG